MIKIIDRPRGRYSIQAVSEFGALETWDFSTDEIIELYGLLATIAAEIMNERAMADCAGQGESEKSIEEIVSDLKDIGFSSGGWK